MFWLDGHPRTNSATPFEVLSLFSKKSGLPDSLSGQRHFEESGSTSLKLPRGVSLTSTLFRTVSGSWSVPRSYQPSAQSCSGARSTTLSVPGRSTQRPDSVKVSEDPFQVSSSVPGCSVLLRAPHTHRLGEGGCVD